MVVVAKNVEMFDYGHAEFGDEWRLHLKKKHGDSEIGCNIR